jgi:hypothetical protein
LASCCCAPRSLLAAGAGLATRDRRRPGAWWGDHTGFFLSTNGGTVGEGQVFEYDPRAETAKLIYDAPNANDLDNPDNMTATPRAADCCCAKTPPVTVSRKASVSSGSRCTDRPSPLR